MEIKYPYFCDPKTMITKNQIKEIISLHHKKGRQEAGLFIVEGKKWVSEILNSELSCIEIYSLPQWLEKNEGDIKVGIRVFEINEMELKKISTLTSPQEVLAILRIPENKADISELKTSLSLILDDISDPGNMGTIIRIADWFGIKNIICSEACVDAYNPKVVQASMGSIARIKLHYAPLLPFFKKNKEEWKIEVFAASMQGENLYQVKTSENGFILMGNESRGINPDYLEYINMAIHIPAYTLDEGQGSHAESLNVAIATALICGEFRRNLLVK